MFLTTFEVSTISNIACLSVVSTTIATTFPSNRSNLRENNTSKMEDAPKYSKNVCILII